MTSSFHDTYFVKTGRITLLSFNELGQKSRAKIIISRFVNKPKSNSDWLIVFGKFFIGQNIKHVHMTYSFLELLMFF